MTYSVNYRRQFGTTSDEDGRLEQQRGKLSHANKGGLKLLVGGEDKAPVLK